MATKKHYFTEEIEFQNGDVTSARPLPIKPLKLMQSVFEDYADDMRKLATLMTEVSEKTRELQEAHQDPEPFIEDAKKRAKEADYMTWNDCLAQAAFIALNSWKVKTKRGTAVEVDMDYIEETLDIPTAQRICEIAGNFEIGDLSQVEPGDTGKAVAG